MKLIPTLCPKCKGTMKIINFIEDLDIIKKILRRLDFWDIHNHGPPVTEFLHIPELVYDYSESQVQVVDYWS